MRRGTHVNRFLVRAPDSVGDGHSCHRRELTKTAAISPYDEEFGPLRKRQMEIVRCPIQCKEQSFLGLAGDDSHFVATIDVRRPEFELIWCGGMRGVHHVLPIPRNDGLTYILR